MTSPNVPFSRGYKRYVVYINDKTKRKRVQDFLRMLGPELGLAQTPEASVTKIDRLILSDQPATSKAIPPQKQLTDISLHIKTREQEFGNPRKAMSLDQRIQSWLRRVEPVTTSQHVEHKHCAKRRRLNPPTPDPSQTSRSMGSSRSKRRAIVALDANDDNDDTLDIPRPPNLQAPRSESGTSLTSSSAASGYSSPTKQLRELKLHPRGVDSRELKDFQNKPASLKTLLQKIDDSVSGFGILPTSQRTCMAELDIKVYDNFEWGPQSSQFFDFLLSTTASILPDYQATSASKKVDFCLYIDPKHVESAQIHETLLALMNVLPMGMFNHTNLLPLSDRPIAVSIETKKTGEGWDNARLQMEVWMAAHWQFLRKILQLHRLAADAVSSLEQSTEFNSHESRRLPEFLPGIIIQGHDWYLIITTSEGEKTIFWQKENFGQTSKSKGIYSIIHNLQLLRKWAQEVYWEWMRELLLSWPRHGGKVLVVADY
ncbi:hypothetical protein FDENT_4517 [Fusarium denticulatum]|uniref:PD-(D/E)XK nuclease-like domain-containing protein n=1 Tax=Fusarium denticulatum TaxID=48507 RepID=A0A8H5UGH1_9HYPO|nr:hypothetical protein FDENT_4517 [Fusarium denticulatum]